MLNFNVARNLVAAAFKPTRTMGLARNGRAERVESAFARRPQPTLTTRGERAVAVVNFALAFSGINCARCFGEEAHITQNIHPAPIGPNE
jgi:hypothetical protein